MCRYSKFTRKLVIESVQYFMRCWGYKKKWHLRCKHITVYVSFNCLILLASYGPTLESDPNFFLQKQTLNFCSSYMNSIHWIMNVWGTWCRFIILACGTGTCALMVEAASELEKFPVQGRKELGCLYQV